MNVKDNVQTEVSRVVIDFGVIDEEEYKVLCATSFNYQGLACASNHVYTEIPSKAKKPKEKFTVVRRASAFEFPHQSFVDAWLKELPSYFKE